MMPPRRQNFDRATLSPAKVTAKRPIPEGNRGAFAAREGECVTRSAEQRVARDG
jgi:hypothetical protein